jgi:DNA-binding XRE family transcriptional regulator
LAPEARPRGWVASLMVISLLRPTSRRAGQHELVLQIARHVGARIRERRIRLGISQHQLARLIGITCQRAHAYEKGINPIAGDRLHRIAEVLGVNPGYFYQGMASSDDLR